MKTNLLFVYLLAFIIISSGAFALSNTTAIKHAYTFDTASTTNTSDIADGSKNLTYVNTIVPFAGGFNGAGIYFGSANANMSFPDFYNGTFTISMHYYFNSSTQDASGWLYQGDRGDGAATLRIMYYAATGFNLNLFRYSESCGLTVAEGAKDRWHHFVFVANDSGCAMYIDGERKQADTSSGYNDLDWGFGGNLGKRNQDATIGMKIDDIAIFENYQINYNDVLELNATSISSYIGPTAQRFVITNTKGVNVFNATVGTYSFNTSNGTITTSLYNNATTLYNVSVSGECGQYFCNYTTTTYNNYNISTNLISNMTFWQNTTFTNSNSVLTYQEQTFTFRINQTSLTENYNITDLDIVLVYNGTAYTPTTTFYYSPSLYAISTVDIITPSFSSNKNITFTWYYNVTRNTSTVGEIIKYSISGVQLVSIIGLDNCSVYTTVALNMTLKNITDDQEIKGHLAGYFEMWVSDAAYYRPFNITYAEDNSLTHFGICINPGTATYTIRGQVLYGGTGLADKEYYFNNVQLSSTTQLLNLYVSPDSSLVQFTVKDDNDDLVQDVYIYVQTYDLATNTAQTTEIIKTASDGTAIGHIFLNTQKYKFILYYNEEIVLETEPTYITSTSQEFKISLLQDYFIDYQNAANVDCSLWYVNSTKSFNLVFADSSGAVNQGCLKISRYSGRSAGQVNISCTPSSSGTLQLFLPSDLGTYTYVGSATMTINGIDYSCGNVTSISFSNRPDFQIGGLFYAFLMVVALIMVGLWSAPTAIILSLFAIVFSWLMQIVSLQISSLITLIILGGLVVYKVSQR